MFGLVAFIEQKEIGNKDIVIVIVIVFFLLDKGHEAEFAKRVFVVIALPLSNIFFI